MPENIFVLVRSNTKTKPMQKQKKERKKWSLTLFHDVGDSLAMWVSLVLKYNDSLLLHLPWILYVVV